VRTTALNAQSPPGAKQNKFGKDAPAK
jgi:hypothetical protein